MSQYKHTDKDGDSLVVKTSYNNANTAVIAPQQGCATFVSAEDAPALCQAILDHSGADAKIVLRRKPDLTPTERSSAIAIALSLKNVETAVGLIASADKIAKYIKEGN